MANLIFQLSEVSVPRRLFQGVLDRIGRLYGKSRSELRIINYNLLDLPVGSHVMTSSQILVQKALAIPANVREAYLLGIPEVELHAHLCRLLENMDSGARCEVTHGRDEYGRDIVLRRSSPFGYEYIAIVVKRGDAKGKISGRTAGPVDAIISQVNQSVAHLCLLKEIEVSSVNLRGVWVMFGHFGRLTNNAVRRIDVEAPALKSKSGHSLLAGLPIRLQNTTRKCSSLVPPVPTFKTKL